MGIANYVRNGRRFGDRKMLTGGQNAKNGPPGVRVCLACLKVTLGRVPPVLALVADRHFFVRAVSLGPQGIRRARFGPPPPPQPRRAPSPDPPPHPPPRPGRRPPTSAAPTRSRTARGRSRRSPGGAPALAVQNESYPCL